MRLMFFFFFLVNIFITGQDSAKIYQSKRNIQVAFYNVENLFDTIDDPHKLDNDFLPASNKKWDTKKYNEKLTNLSKVIDAMMPGKYGPDLIGLCEVESRWVVEDLAVEPLLKRNQYEVVHYESPDKRGIDVAAMYNSRKLKLLATETIEVPFPEDGRIKTRNILYIKFTTLKSKDTVHVFFNHWPSRMGGEEKSEWKRVRAAETLMEKVDSVISFNVKAKVVIMGDLNDYPTNHSVADVVCREDSSVIVLKNLMVDYHAQGFGTYNYKGAWGVLDNVIVSKYLLGNTEGGINVFQEKAYIFRKDWLLYTNKKGEKSPAKTMGGSTYYGGYSDHLPVYLLLKY